MDDVLRTLLLAMCGIGAFVALIVTYLWYFVFGKSLRAVLMAGLGILLNRDSTIDLDADVEIVKRPDQVKKEMPGEVAAIDFEGTVSASNQYVPYIDDDAGGFGAQSVDMKPGQNELISSSFEDGRFRRLTQALSRPFLKMRLAFKSDVPAKNVRRGADSPDVE